MPTKPTKSATKISKPFEIRGKGSNCNDFKASVYDFLCQVYDKDIDSNFGRKLFEKLESKLNEKRGLRALCTYQTINGEEVPTLSLRRLERLMFKLGDKDVKTARGIIRTLTNQKRIVAKTTREVLHDDPKPTADATTKVIPAPTKDQPTYYKMWCYNAEPIRGIMHTSTNDDTNIYWSVFDFLCATFGHPMSSNFGRQKYARLNKHRAGEVEELATRLKIRKTGTETPTMTADQLIDLSLMFKHVSLDAARLACAHLARVAEDYTQCIEVFVDDSV
jgi:hypothetical protein